MHYRGNLFLMPICERVPLSYGLETICFRVLNTITTTKCQLIKQNNTMTNAGTSLVVKHLKVLPCLREHGFVEP